MDEKLFDKLKLEIEELNNVPGEEKNFKTDEEFKLYMEKQLNRICKIKQESSNKTSAALTRSLQGMYVSPRQEDTEYRYPDLDQNHSERGLAVIINNEIFRTYSNRDGSIYDEVALYQTFKNLGFTVWVTKNLTAEQINIVLEIARTKYSHKDAAYFVCAVLSHGERLEHSEYTKDWTRHDSIDGVDGKIGDNITTGYIVKIFNDRHCPGLKGKPRLFFFQACRGEIDDLGVGMLVEPDAVISGRNENNPSTANQNVTGQTASDSFPSTACSSSTNLLSDIRCVPYCPSPLYTDCLIMYATPPGFYAYRNEFCGSPFVQDLCSVLDKHDFSKQSLINALTQVVGSVAKNFETDHKSKVTPVIENMLTKDVFFTI